MSADSDDELLAEVRDAIQTPAHARPRRRLRALLWRRRAWCPECDGPILTRHEYRTCSEKCAEAIRTRLDTW